MANSYGRPKEVRAVSRAITILEILAQEQIPLRLVTISRLTGINPTTTHRLLQTLMLNGFVAQDVMTGKYTLGFRVFKIGSSIKHISNKQDITRPYLQKLMEQSKETACLAVLDDLRATYVQQIAGVYFLRTSTEIGRSVPLHATAVGKALLTGFCEHQWEELKQQGLKRFTSKTITCINKLREHVEDCWAKGYTTDFEEFETGTYCLGVPIADRDGKPVCAISISGPASRLSTERIKRLTPVIVSVAAEISHVLKVVSTSPNF